MVALSAVPSNACAHSSRCTPSTAAESGISATDCRFSLQCYYCSMLSNSNDHDCGAAVLRRDRCSRAVGSEHRACVRPLLCLEPFSSRSYEPSVLYRAELILCMRRSVCSVHSAHVDRITLGCGRSVCRRLGRGPRGRQLLLESCWLLKSQTAGHNAHARSYRGGWDRFYYTRPLHNLIADAVVAGALLTAQRSSTVPARRALVHRSPSHPFHSPALAAPTPAAHVPHVVSSDGFHQPVGLVRCLL